jgi:hypothetical protein
MRFWQKYLFLRKFLRNYVQSRSGCAREREKIEFTSKFAETKASTKNDI